LRPRAGDQTVDEPMAEAVLTAFRRNAECVDHRNGVLLAELAAQDARNGEAAQRAAIGHSDVDEIARPRFGRREALLEEMPPALTGNPLVDRDDLIEVRRRNRTRLAC